MLPIGTGIVLERTYDYATDSCEEFYTIGKNLDDAPDWVLLGEYDILELPPKQNKSNRKACKRVGEKSTQLNLLEVVRTIRKGGRVDSVFFSDWETEYNRIEDTKEQGYAIEWLCNAYLMFLQHEGKSWKVLEDNGEEVCSASSINLGKRGGVGYGGHSPDIIACCDDEWTLGS